MEKLTEQQILDRTHYGLNIYAYVLRQYDSGTILSLSGRECAPVSNPFTEGRESLQLVFNDGKFVFKGGDTGEHNSPFDFAAMHFQLEGQELLRAIDKALDLKLVPTVELPTVKKQHNITNPVFNYFKKPIANITPYREVRLLDVFRVVRGSYFRKPTEFVRSILHDAPKARKFKAASFDYVTFSGVFSTRSNNNLLSHSGLVALDFDHLKQTQVQKLKEQLLKDEYFETQLLFTSPSGRGVKWVINIDLNGMSHYDYVSSVISYTKATYNVEVDAAGKDVSRACYLPYDPEAYINPKYFL
ncbi:BT4734/BF3469 family protein [Fulvivirga kasyanovii]|uniref:VirE protein n=1 Tax=Fulvivirga kasyanovii TaxID=396812 RepID=A0ABW9RKW9_9BACT|nr:BT4734/BF3469 family protein [Fulvivirga kasyanovii]MTI24737.1 VirE protein [Fulvivirga kasyanovii]